MRRYNRQIWSGVKSTLSEVARHVQDRNDLIVPQGNPRRVAWCVMIEQYVRENSEDFEEAPQDTVAWRYRGTTDAEPLPYDTLDELVVEEDDDEADDDPEEEEDDDGKMRMTLSLDDGDDGE